jgi:CBS domain-containing protein
MTTQPNPSNHEILQAVRFHPFFQGVEESTALSLLRDCEHKYFEKNKVILYADTARTGFIFIIKGSAEVYIENEASQHEEVLEVIQKGELIGLSSLADFLGVSRPHVGAMVEVRAAEDMSALFIPFEIVLKRWDDPSVRDYLLTHMAIRLKDVYTSLAEQIKLSKAFFEKGAILRRVQDLMREPAVTVCADANIMEAARKMSSEKVSSVAVVEAGELVGILTERDIVSRLVAEGMDGGKTAVRSMMTGNPLTIGRFAYYYDALSCMLLGSIKHLPVLDDDGKLVGMVTLTDLLRKKNESYIKTLRSIEGVEESRLPLMKEAMYEMVDTLVKDRVPALKLLDTVTALYDRLVVRVVELAVANLERAGLAVGATPFAFYQMGSSGRREQFLLTDQDHFLVYEEGAGAEVEEYFERLGGEITRLLECAGYRRCAGLMMASERGWRGSVSEWEERLRGWMVQSSNEKLLLAQNFFSYRFMAGSRSVDSRFEEALRSVLDRSKIFLFRLTQVEREHVVPTLDSPLRSFLKRERKPLDMKKEILFPFHHSLQILSLVHGDVGGTPLQRMEKLVEKGVLSVAFSEELEAALGQVLMLYIRLRWESSGNNSGLALASLTTLEKQALSSSLKAFRELQSLVFAHFSV